MNKAPKRNNQNHPGITLATTNIPASATKIPLVLRMCVFTRGNSIPSPPLCNSYSSICEWWGMSETYPIEKPFDTEGPESNGS